jgi:CheY-like chemotaxis protein
MATILIVDDDPDISEALTEALEASGYEVAAAKNGVQALDWLRRSPAPCLILLDLMMPVMDGYEFLEQQKRDPKLASVPVVVITAGRRIAGPKMIDVADVLLKPFALGRLKSVVQQYCN